MVFRKPAPQDNHANLVGAHRHLHYFCDIGYRIQLQDLGLGETPQAKPKYRVQETWREYSYFLSCRPVENRVLVVDHQPEPCEEVRVRDVFSFCHRNLGYESSDRLVEFLERCFSYENVRNPAVPCPDQFSIVDMKATLVVVEPQTLDHIVGQVSPRRHQSVYEPSIDKVSEQESKPSRNHGTSYCQEDRVRRISKHFRNNVCGFSDPASSKDPCPTHFADKIVQIHTWTQSEMSYSSGPFRREGRVSPFCERSSCARERPNTQLQLQRQEIP